MGSASRSDVFHRVLIEGKAAVRNWVAQVQPLNTCAHQQIIMRNLDRPRKYKREHLRSKNTFHTNDQESVHCLEMLLTYKQKQNSILENTSHTDLILYASIHCWPVVTWRDDL